MLPVTATLNVAIVNPRASDVYKSGSVTFNATINSSAGIEKAIFNISNASASIAYAASQNTSSSWTAAVDMNSLVTGLHAVTFIAQDVSGNGNSTSVNFTIDRTGPVLADITEMLVNESSATIQWATDEAADAKVQYGASTSLGTEKSAGEKAVSHSILLTALNANATYHYTVASCDGLSNCNTSALKIFTTAAAPHANSTGSGNSSGSAGNSSGNSSGSSSSGSSSGGSSSGSGGGSSGSSSSSSSSTEEVQEAESVSEDVAEVPAVENTGLQVAGEEEATSEDKSNAEKQQDAEKSGLPLAAAQDKPGFGNLITGFVSAAVFGELSSREYLLAGLTALSVVLTIAFIIIRKREHDF